jgi:hypothetical protein
MQKPSISQSKSNGDGRIVVRHREYVGEVTGQTAFTVVSYSVNPGLAATFPWLSTVAQNYESYRFRRLCFDFETAVSTATSGSIQMAFDYDAADSAPSTKAILMAYHNAVRSPAWGECCCTADSSDLNKFGTQRFIRSSALAANQDVKTYDVANFHLAVSGFAGATVSGELYVDYEVELITPQSVASGAPGLSDWYLSNLFQTGAAGSCLATATWTGPLAASVAGSTITLPAGSYEVLVGTRATGAYFWSFTGTASRVSKGPCLANTFVSVCLDVVSSGSQTLVIENSAGAGINNCYVMIRRTQGGFANFATASTYP